MDMERLYGYFVVLATALTMAGCGNGGGASSPAAAKVNGSEISMAQVSWTAARGGNVSADHMKKTGPRALESLIDQQVLVQKALEAKLDQDPQTALALDTARKQVLAQAYMDKTLATVPKPTPEEVRAFYNKNPILFEMRRVFRFQELNVVIEDEKFDEINKFAQKAKNLSEIGAWLKARNLPFTAGDSTKAAEELSMDMLPHIAKMSDGQIAVLRGRGRAAILQLVQSQQAPLDLVHATAQIEQFLTNGKRFEVGNAEVKKLRDAAKIEYVGDFAATKPGADLGKAAAK
jgi:EpsD family peptidyl-prolyl cis-trans isomerase